MTVKLSCIPICLFDDLIHTRSLSLHDWVKMAAELGLDSIEIYKPYLNPDERNPDVMRRISDVIHEAGLGVSMFTSYCDLSHPEPAERERQLSSIRWDVEALGGAFQIEPNANRELGHVRVSHGEHRLFLITWEMDGKACGNRYLLGKPPFSLAQYKDFLERIAVLPEPFDAGSVGA